MKRIQHPVRIIAALLFFMLPARAMEFLDTAGLLERAAEATIEKYPDADDVLIDDFVQVTYETDGTSETWDDMAVKILTEKGKRDNRTLTLRFDTAYGTNCFTRVQVIKPDGTVVEVDIAAQSKVMVDPEQMGSNIYNPNDKVLTLSVPGLEIGDLLRAVAHEIRYKAVVPGTWSDYQVFEHTSPIERYTYQVIAPTALPLRSIALKSEIPGTVTFNELQSDRGDRIVYTWEVRDVPRMFDEPDMPARYTVVQRLLVSTLLTWDELSIWYWHLCLPRLEAVTPAMEAKARELIEGKTNTLDRIGAIFNFVSQDIRYMGLTTEEEAPGYEPHDVCITFENRYGVCRDKAALLAAMLRMVDIEAFPVIIMAGPKKDEDVPQPFFNHAVTAALGDDGEYILMDSTDENTRDIFPAYLQNMSYLVARPEGETLRTSPIIPADDNLLRIATEGALDADGRLTAESLLAFEGVNDTVYRGYFSRIKPEERRRFFEGHLRRSMPTAELKSVEILPKELRDTETPLTVRLTYTADNLLIEGIGYRMLNLPRLGESLGYVNFLIGQTGLQERKYPLYTRLTAGIRETLSLSLPDDAGAPELPDYTDIDTEQVTWAMGIGLEDQQLTATNTFLINAVEFSPEEYLTLKQNLKEIEYNLRKKLILTDPGEQAQEEADVRILEQTRSITLEDAERWTETLGNKVEILTYAGTKQFAEIRKSFNPAWQELKLVSATVTLPDGTVRSVSDEEINLMDSEWAASAPRYPAEKILVANLPGVEVGSIIEYELTSTVRGKPFFSTVQTFNGHEPIDRTVFTLSAPSGLDLQIRNTGVQESCTTNGATVSYVWQAENQPAVKKEESLPAWWTFNPAVFVSAGHWKSYGTAVRETLLAAAEQQDAAELQARQLTYGLRDPMKRATVLRDWVAKNIRPTAPAFTELPLSSITPADLTLREGYGNNADRMVLLYAMLKAAKLEPEFVLTGGISLIPEEAEPLLSIPALNAFSTVLVRVEINDNVIYLDAASQHAAMGTSAYNRRPLLDPENGAIETMEVAVGMDDRQHIQYELSISQDGTAGLTQTTEQQGTAFEQFHRTYAEITPEERRRHYLEMLADFSQSAVATSDLITDYSGYPGTLQYSAVAEHYAVRDGDYLYLTVPAGLTDHLISYRSSRRTLPLAWNKPINFLVEINILLPEDFDPLILPKDFSWQAPEGAGMVEVAVFYSPLAHAVRIVQMADLKPALLQAADFPEIIDAGRRLAHPDMRTILLKRKGD